MSPTSSIFDRIRIRPTRKRAAAEAAATPCAHPGCKEPGEFKAPKGRDREGEYFNFCMHHVREYNATYDYFRGMDDVALAKFRDEAIVGHRPTWKMGQRGAAGATHVDESMFAAARAMRRKGVKRGEGQAAAPRYNALALKALSTLDLDEKATVTAIKNRYKALVKLHHPDANGGDRSSEEKLREIIQAYNYLRANKLV